MDSEPAGTHQPEDMEGEPVTTRRAIWRAGWYELDQPITVGQHSEFEFFESLPECFASSGADLAFFNQLKPEMATQVRTARVIAIDHPQLGSLDRIDTRGLDYVFALTKGEEIVVNAEENPGRIVDNPVEVTDWIFIVTLSDVSDPVADIT